MARIRSIHPGLFTDEAFVQLSDAAQMFFLGLWTEADDQGVFEWKPVTLRMRLRPTKDGPVEPLLGEIETVGSIRRFEVSGRQYGAIRNFRKYQRPKSPNAVHPITNEIRTYVALSIPISEIDGVEQDQFPPNGEISQQMEDGGDKMEEEGGNTTSGAASPPPSALDPPFIEIPTNRFETTGEEYPVYERMIEEFQELYPGVDVRVELRKMRGWALSNDLKRKTKRGMKSFINSWLARQQDRPSPRETSFGGRNGGSGKNDSFLAGTLAAVATANGITGGGEERGDWGDAGSSGVALPPAGLRTGTG